VQDGVLSGKLTTGDAGERPLITMAKIIVMKPTTKVRATNDKLTPLTMEDVLIFMLVSRLLFGGNKCLSAIFGLCYA
jgi:hypothetical protein